MSLLRSFSLQLSLSISEDGYFRSLENATVDWLNERRRFVGLDEETLGESVNREGTDSIDNEFRQAENRNSQKITKDTKTEV